MQTARRRRTTWAIAASVLAHGAVLVLALIYRAVLPLPPDEAAGPPEAIIPLLILPRTPAPLSSRGLQPAPIQLHRRSQRNLPAEAPQPIIVPVTRPAEISQPAAQASVAAKAPTPPPAPSDAVRSVLRATLGCTESAMAGLTREERAGCADRLGRGAHDAPYLAPALSSEKRALLDQAGMAKMAKKLIAERPIPGAVPESGKAEPQDYSGEPDVATNAVPAHSFPPSKRAAKTLGRLPP